MSNYAIFFSPTRNTKKVVCAIAEGFGETFKKYDLTTPFGRKKNIRLQENDTIIVGVPVYGGRIPQLIISALQKLNENGMEGINAVVAVTYGVREYDDALLELSDLLEKQKIHVIGAAAMIGEHSFSKKVGTGRPNNIDLNEARTFGEEVRKHFGTVCNNKLLVRGNFPYKPYGTVSFPKKLITTDACTKCGICSNLCPTGAISTTDQKHVNLELCIKCHTCIKNCPVMAKSFDDENIQNNRTMLEDKYCNEEKENQFFL